MAHDKQSTYEQALDRVSSMTQAGQQKPEYKDEEHERFAIHSRVAEEEGHWGHIVAD
jgi:hypothetical protein